MRDPIPTRQTPTKEKVAARQGSKEKMNVRVLVTSLALIALIFAGIYFMFLAAPHSENEGTGAGQTMQVPGGGTPPATRE